MKKFTITLSLILFYFVTSVLFLNRLTFDQEVSVSPCELNSHPRFQKSIIFKILKEEIGKIESLELNRLFIYLGPENKKLNINIRLSLRPKKFFQFIDNQAQTHQIIKDKIQVAMQATTRCTNHIPNRSYVELNTNSTYYFNHKIKGLLSIFLYSVIFTFIALIVIYSKQIIFLWKKVSVR